MTEIPSTAIEAAAEALGYGRSVLAEALYPDTLEEVAAAMLEASGLPTQLQVALERAERAETRENEWRLIAFERKAERDQLASQLQEARGVVVALLRFCNDPTVLARCPATDRAERFLSETKS
jgi:hypothetical protein